MLFLTQLAPTADRYAAVREAFRHWDRGSDAVSTVWLVAALTSIILIAGGVAVAQRLRARLVRERPLALFHRVAGQIGLRWRDQWLLIQIARQQQLPSPLTLLVCTATLRHHARAFAEPAPERRRRRLLARVDGIARSLFEGPGL